LPGLLEECKLKLVDAASTEAELLGVCTRSCDHVLRLLSHPALNVNAVMRSLSRATMRYDANAEAEGNSIKIKIEMSLVTHVEVQILSDTATHAKKETVSIQLFYKQPWTQNNKWMRCETDFEQTAVEIQNMSIRALRLNAFFTEQIKIKIKPNKTTSISKAKHKIAISICGQAIGGAIVKV